ncbi:MAG: M23 family metallopeptidase [Deltaproteobacteria bacterium]|jgi:murein DD-endopeptidase MepM/ murein hydrolase activator NlpD|nr:M23 family metallopeptidase [Deltaproteobacteria bacterium]
MTFSTYNGNGANMFSKIPPELYSDDSPLSHDNKKSKIVTYKPSDFNKTTDSVSIPLNVIIFAVIIFLFLIPTAIISYKTINKGIVRDIFLDVNPYLVHKEEVLKLADKSKRVTEYETKIKSKALELSQVVQQAKDNSLKSHIVPSTELQSKPKSWREKLGLNSGSGGGEDSPAKIKNMLNSENSKPATTNNPSSKPLNEHEVTSLIDSITRDILELPIGTPVQGLVTSGYGLRKSPFHKGKTQLHLAIDIATSTGTEIIATAPGKIKQTGFSNTLGLFIVIEHANGILTRYGHLSKIKTIVGKNVKRNQIIGEVGSTGRSTGPHVHYEIYMNGKRVNPIYLIRLANEIEDIWNT